MQIEAASEGSGLSSTETERREHTPSDIERDEARVAHGYDENVLTVGRNDTIVVDAKNRPAGCAERGEKRGVVGALGGEAVGQESVVAEAHLEEDESDT